MGKAGEVEKQPTYDLKTKKITVQGKVESKFFNMALRKKKNETKTARGRLGGDGDRGVRA